MLLSSGLMVVTL